MNLSLRDILVVKTINEEGHLTQAAEKLFVTQSALSHQLKKIEKTLQAEVFSRLGKKLIITPTGKRLIQSSNTIEIELRKLYKDLEIINEGQKGTVSISTECYTCYHWLPPIIKAFQLQHPNIQIKIISEATRQPINYLEKAQLDLAIVSDTNDNKELSFRKLFDDEMLAVLAQDHPLANKKILHPKDFEQQTMVLYDVPDDHLFFLREFIKPNEIKLKQLMKFELTEAIVEIIAAGLGIGIMANWAAAGYLESKKLVLIPISKKPIKRTWYTVSLKNFKRPVVDHFVSFLENWSFNKP